MRTTQDDARENKQIEVFELTALQGRSNKYIPDATFELNGKTVQVELKTSDVRKRQVSTARNVTLPKLDEYKKVLWVFSQYQKTEEGFVFTGEHYACRGEDLEPWLEKQRQKLLWGTKSYAGLEHWEECKRVCEGKVSADVLTKIDNVLQKRAGLNDPKINWTTVEQLGTRLDPTRLAQHLREVAEDN